MSTTVIISFLRRSGCSLRSFSMIFSTISPYIEGLMNLLQSMPSLNTLSIISTTRRFVKTTTPEDYDPRNIFRIMAKVLSSQSASLQEGHLSDLKILEYTGELYLCPGNYDDLYSSLYSLPSADNAVHGPLHLVKLDLHPATRLPETMIYLSSLVVTENVSLHPSDLEKIIQPSINYYRCRKDFLCRIGLMTSTRVFFLCKNISN